MGVHKFALDKKKNVKKRKQTKNIISSNLWLLNLRQCSQMQTRKVQMFISNVIIV